MVGITLGNRLFRQLIALSFWQRIALTVAVICISLTVWLITLYLPLAHSVMDYQQEVLTIKNHTHDIETLQKQAQILEQKIAGAQTQLSTHQNLSKEVSQVLPLVAQQAKKCGLCLDNGSLEEGEKTAICFQASGPLNQIMTMLADTSSINGLLTLERVTLNLVKDNVYHVVASLSLAKY